MRHVVLLLLTVSLPGCAALSERFGTGPGAQAPSPAAAPIDPFVAAEEAPAELAPETAAPPPPPAARTAEALDTTTPEQRAAAAAPAEAEGRVLGRTIVSLGSPTEPGLWLKTPLVSEETQGRVTVPGTGKSSVVTLIPLDGPPTAGSQMSLAAMRLVELSLTDLTEVEVALEG